MTRLEKQIADKEKELKELKEFVNEKMNHFNSVKSLLIEVLKKYGINEFNTDNSFVDRGVTDHKLILRIYLTARSLNLLSTRRRSNLEQRLRKLVSMPFNPFSYSTIHICYYN